jgi:hypothetical protein
MAVSDQEFAELAGEVRAMRAELRRAADRQAIFDRVVQYARGLDRQDFDLTADVFHPDAIDHHGGFLGGRSEYVEWVKGAILAHHVTTHLITNHTCELDGDTAHAETYLVFYTLAKDEKTITIGGGRYIDRFERREREWRIALRRTVMDWMLPDVAAGDGRPWLAEKRYTEPRHDREDISYMRPLTLSPELSERLARAAK